MTDTGSTAVGAVARPTSRATTTLVVAIATYHRLEPLRHTLEEVLRQIGELDVRARILVVDNDAEASAGPIVAEFDGIDYVVEPSPGIAAARNRALTEAAAEDLLIFIDDDERPTEKWLVHMVDCYFDTDCAAVVGPVVSTFETDVEDWITQGGFFERRRMATGTAIARAATNNLLLDLHRVREHELRFDERFGLSGGSDSLFTSQLTATGAVMRWCDEAIVVDHVPSTRMTRDWVLKRAMRYGNSASRTEIALSGGGWNGLKVRTVLLARGLVRIGAGAIRFAAGTALHSVRHQARGRRTMMKGIGYVKGVFGSVYVEYARP
jgi:succinoglycan biosynthesis protein ExoM